MPPFTAKPVTWFLLRIALMLAVLLAVFYYLLHSSGHESIKPSTNSASFALDRPGPTARA